jgi:hypothetical protein
MLNFNELELASRAEYVEAFAKFDPYADYFFNNIFTWLAQKNSVEWARHKEAIVLKFMNPFVNSKEYSYSYLADASSTKIFKYLSDEIGIKEFNMLPAVSLENIDSKLLENYEVTVDDDNSDYIYDAESIIKLVGPKSKGFLRQVNYYLKNHSVDSIVQSIDLDNPHSTALLINSIHTWRKIYTHNDIEKDEAKAIERYIMNTKVLRPKCIAVIINNKIEAFSIYSKPPQKEYIILSHAKTSYEYKGLFDFLVYATLARASAESPSIKYLNFEQDLGIEGIKRHKMSMKPIRKLHKYNVIKN